MDRCALSKWAQEATSLPAQLLDCVHWTSQMIEESDVKERADAPKSTLRGGGWTDDWTELIVVKKLLLLFKSKRPRHPLREGDWICHFNIIMGWKIESLEAHGTFVCECCCRGRHRFFPVKGRISISEVTTLPFLGRLPIARISCLIVNKCRCV